MTGIAEQTKIIMNSGLFDIDYYMRTTHQAFTSSIDAIHFYCVKGEKLGHSPNFLFDPTWYRSNYNYFESETALAHYIITGASLGNEPSLLFDSKWVSRQLADIRNGETPLAAYMRSDKTVTSANRFFDPVYYMERNSDIRNAPVEPFEHFLNWGVFEGRRPSADFDLRHISQRYLGGAKDVNVFRSFLKHYRELGWRSSATEGETSVASEIKMRVGRSDRFEERQLRAAQTGAVRALALYLPQFHSIPENDKWWGPGFTEWTNLGRATPRFKGHYQPRIPRDLGFYDLTNTDVMKRQIEMAAAAGLQGFCFYYYNFGGHTLLETPLRKYASDENISFPFCLMWVNENWTRRWDGAEQEVLIESDSSWESLSSLVDSIAAYMARPNYIRVGDSPILFIYRGDVIADSPETLDRVRERFSVRYGFTPILVMAQTFGKVDPRPLGFDAALEFPPHKLSPRVADIAAKVEKLDPDFIGEVKDYDAIVGASLEDFPSDYPLIKTVLPSWDNDARRQGAGMVIHGSTPAKFQAWVEAIVQNPKLSSIGGDKFIVVNAWNEWCEGAYLEPDIHYGFAYLNALSRGLRHVGLSTRRKIVLVGHDAFPAGSQHLLLEIGDLFKRRFGLDIFYILDSGGALLESYRSLGSTYVAKDAGSNYWPKLASHLANLRQQGVDSAISNTAFSGHLVSALDQLGFRTCSLIHELGTTLESGHGTELIQSIFKHSEHVVFPSEFVKQRLSPRFGAPAKAVHILPQGVYKRISPAESEQVSALRASLDIAADELVVLGVGYADLRKGIDRFLAMAEYCARLDWGITFIWVGGAHPDVEAWLLSAAHTAANKMKWVQFTEEINVYYSLADVLLLPSREDPFPSVVLEALSAGVPVAGFSGCGGFVDLLADERLGLLFPTESTSEAAELLVQYVRSPIARNPLDQQYRIQYMLDRFDFAAYGSRILNLVMPLRTISVVVPNYNYKRFLERRLASIAEQTYPVFEIIVLDDCSTDNSVEEIERVSALIGRDITLVENATNSGSPFAQWKLGASLARGDLIWIAEADDIARPGLLEALVGYFDSQRTTLAFCDSSAVDESGKEMWRDHKEYYHTIFPGALAKSALFDGKEFAANYLSVKNAIVNVSAVLWRRDVLLTVLERCEDSLKTLTLAGDWLMYLEACRLGDIGYNATQLNAHCRQDRGVTRRIGKRQHLNEIKRMHEQAQTMFKTAGKQQSQQQYLEELQILLK